MHLLDTPGVLPPKIESVETGMKLALCGEGLVRKHSICLFKKSLWSKCFDLFIFISGNILDHLVGEDVIADYLLYSLNRLGKFRFELVP